MHRCTEESRLRNGQVEMKSVNKRKRTCRLWKSLRMKIINHSKSTSVMVIIGPHTRSWLGIGILYNSYVNINLTTDKFRLDIDN